MKVLVACEFSGVVRDAFTRRGHFAWSCDLLPAERRSLMHWIGDVREILGVVPDLGGRWDLMIAHPPCTYLARSGARWWKGREQDQEKAIAFVRELMGAPIRRIALENPPGAIGTRIRPADQYIQPWQFGHPELKMTGLWLKNLPLLRPRNPLPRKPAPLLKDHKIATLEAGVHREPPGPDRWKNRSRTLQGIADAMAEQWGSLEAVRETG